MTSNTFDMKKLASISRGYSGADIKEVCNRALLDTLSNNKSQPTNLTQEGIEAAIKTYKKMPKYIKFQTFWGLRKIFIIIYPGHRTGIPSFCCDHIQ